MRMPVVKAKSQLPFIVLILSACLALAALIFGAPLRANAPDLSTEIPDVGFDGPAGEAFRQGAKVYRANCAACHDNPRARMPQKFVLRNMRPAMILRALAAKSSAYETQRLLATAEYRNGNLPNALAAIEVGASHV